MDWQLQIKMNEKLYLRDPEQSEVGRKILKHGALMIQKMGLEEFTFKKLAREINTNESSVYRYFENKHRLLTYLLSWYWRWMEYQVIFHTKNIDNVFKKIEIIIDILLLNIDTDIQIGLDLDKEVLHDIVIKEASKSYLTHHVTEDNKQQFFKPYKELCARIAKVMLEVNPNYPYPRSLTSTIIEMSHFQHFFMHFLPSLTDFAQTRNKQVLHQFLKHLIIASLTYEKKDLLPVILHNLDGK
ncbi:MAG: TetR/AcrR family transcriptional regulator [Flammeovirgaceae bacterium]|nr:TetR/AcrR family transcriptional regulator [Flammeovirgaceae bacterium]MDW8288550.1 TetR/AcrR family transcriptional regulator [Flammeovirgaceae bacterium]